MEPGFTSVKTNPVLDHMSRNLLVSPFDGKLNSSFLSFFGEAPHKRAELILMALKAEDLSVEVITQQSLQDPVAEGGSDRVLSLKSRDMDQLSPHTCS